MDFIWNLSEAKALKKAIRGQKDTFFEFETVDYCF